MDALNRLVAIKVNHVIPLYSDTALFSTQTRYLIYTSTVILFEFVQYYDVGYLFSIKSLYFLF